MSFLGNIINEFTHSNSGQHQQQQQQQQSGGYGGGYGGGQGYGGGGENYGQNYGGQQQGGPPQVHPPWRAVWDDRDNRWLYINEQNGERTFEHPGHGNYNNYGSNNNYNNNNSGYYPPQQQQQQYYPEEQQRAEKKHGGGHGMAYGAMGAAAGLAGGALLMHEGEEVRRDWDRDEDRVENKMGQWGRDVEDAPEDVARWTGEKVRCVMFRLLFLSSP